MLSEKLMKGFSGWLMVFVLFTLLLVSVLMLAVGGGFAERNDVVGGILIIFGVIVLVVDAVCWAGFTVVNPNEAKVVQLFGVYKGTIKEQGFYWVNPLTSRRRVSLRIRNFESSRLKVNDHDGNPIEIAAVVVWRVIETAEAVFHVDDYENFVHVQSESAVRNLATTYPYDAHEEDQLSLRMSSVYIAHRLRQ